MNCPERLRTEIASRKGLNGRGWVTKGLLGPWAVTPRPLSSIPELEGEGRGTSILVVPSLWSWVGSSQPGPQQSHSSHWLGGVVQSEKEVHPPLF